MIPQYVDDGSVVHLSVKGLWTICGLAFSTEPTEYGFQPYRQMQRSLDPTVTCADCAAIVRACRGVRVKTK